jgi:hypothetical protein
MLAPWVRPVDEATKRAMPKSQTFNRPDFSTIRLPGLMSRCTTCISCAAASASASWIPYDSRSSSGSPEGNRSITLPRSSPSSSSITRNNRSSCSSKSNTTVIPGCCSDAASSASLRNRATSVGEVPSAGGSTLTATGRRNRWSIPRQTSPIAPLPSG